MSCFVKHWDMVGCGCLLLEGGTGKTVSFRWFEAKVMEARGVEFRGSVIEMSFWIGRGRNEVKMKGMCDENREENGCDWSEEEEERIESMWMWEVETQMKCCSSSIVRYP
jgi:hypothetical protein